MRFVSYFYYKCTYCDFTSKISDAHDLNFRAKLKIKQRFRPLEVSKVCWTLWCFFQLSGGKTLKV